MRLIKNAKFVKKIKNRKQDPSGSRLNLSNKNILSSQQKIMLFFFAKTENYSIFAEEKLHSAI